MTQYVAGFYRINQPLTEKVLQDTLHKLYELNSGFFPAKLFTSPNSELIFSSPSAFKRELVPRLYFIDDTDCHIPFGGQGSVRFTFTESSDPGLTPASLVIEFNDDMFSQYGWSVETLIRIFKEIIVSLIPDFGWLYDQEQRARPYYRDVMFDFESNKVPIGVFWLNYYGKEWVENIGKARLRRIEQVVPYFEWLNNGDVLFAIQKEPYVEQIHGSLQKSVEKQLGIIELHQQYSK